MATRSIKQYEITVYSVCSSACIVYVEKSPDSSYGPDSSMSHRLLLL
jgi:hypothetical protein